MMTHLNFMRILSQNLQNKVQCRNFKLTSSNSDSGAGQGFGAVVKGISNLSQQRRYIDRSIEMVGAVRKPRPRKL